jgi:hypothetical protein
MFGIFKYRQRYRTGADITRREWAQKTGGIGLSIFDWRFCRQETFRLLLPHLPGPYGPLSGENKDPILTEMPRRQDSVMRIGPGGRWRRARQREHDPTVTAGTARLLRPVSRDSTDQPFPRLRASVRCRIFGRTPIEHPASTSPSRAPAPPPAPPTPPLPAARPPTPAPGPPP